MISLFEAIKENVYPGRGIVIGATPDEKNAVVAYFIMGRSENSRNRVFVATEDGVRTEAFDASKMSDPSLVIYNAVRVLGNKTIVSNGDQTDTIYTGLDMQKTFEESLQSREFEPDPPILTPRISGVVRLHSNSFNYALSILKSADGNALSCNRFLYTYKPAVPGAGHFIHTYAATDDPAAPPKSFYGEPKAVAMGNDIEKFTGDMWEALNQANKISLFVRYIDVKTGTYTDKIVNKNK
jgi:IMP cyclohydrolase